MNNRDTVTELMLETFRFNGRLLQAGDALVADIGLTSARWQVLGAIALSPVALPVAHIARNMGLSRQGVQRLVREMIEDGLLRLAPNPHHARAQLVLLTPHGKSVYAAAMKRQGPWADRLGTGLAGQDLAKALKVLRALRQRLENSTHEDSTGKA
ncbi:MarR family winged helix-turn-helix transcriptional regulator [Dongia mobilis]|jgi:DNA-binding MarR family transcriptional regulator|uniref:MarR family winged helix-turn-helix transcriptional regulator n=1 Tax=Dongia sp. TaxID=1977262 RepID=UPI0026EAAC3B